MPTKPPEPGASTATAASESVARWLLDADPSLRWQTLPDSDALSPID